MKIRFEIQRVVFFAGCTIAGLTFIALAIFGSIPNRGFIGALGAVGGALSGHMLFKAVRAVRNKRGQDSS